MVNRWEDNFSNCSGALPFVILGRESAVDIESPYGLDGPGIESRCGRDFLHPSRSALGSNQPLVKWVPCLFPQGVKGLGRGVDLATPHIVLSLKKN